jgi:hypothetical protein
MVPLQQKPRIRRQTKANTMRCMRVVASGVLAVGSAAVSACVHYVSPESGCYGTGELPGGIPGEIDTSRVRLAKVAGAWELRLANPEGRASVVHKIALAMPVAVPESMRLNHVWYDAVVGDTEDDFRPLLRESPSSTRMVLYVSGDSVGGIIGTTMSIVGVGDLVLRGDLREGRITGRWAQLAVAGCPTGVFELRRPDV